MLLQTFKSAVRAGGPEMSAAKQARIFGFHADIRRNVFHACREAHLAGAIQNKVINDHRVIESVRKMGPRAASIMLGVEARLGRKLQRSRASELAATYLRITNERQAMEMVRNVLAGFAQSAKEIA